MKAVVITGVSTGIGRASTEVLVNAGYHVFGSVRKQEDADALKIKLGENYTPLLFDVRDEEAVKRSVEQVKQRLGTDGQLIGLVNNAGIGLGGPSQHLDVDIFRKQFEVNFFGVVSVTNAFLELLGARKDANRKGKIIMISSIGGKRAFPFLGPYTASKHAIEGYSDALRIELQLYGIDVIVIEPGAVITAIWDKVPDPQDNPFINTEYATALQKFYGFFIKEGKKGLPAEVIGNTVKNILETDKPKTRYVLVKNKFRNFILPSILPDRKFDKMIGKALGLLDR
ncbi:MAG TPA: SDR family oxidoreductase [Candidatus Marinimicrobia bacterium]|jgi:NAD(P)-dependent dehydrogenase (short-subunit alcohol dehydrogenase family)|nr:SDR family oxidoreductase [Candidatus Neomarinimicrobiota bacterium]